MSMTDQIQVEDWHPVFEDVCHTIEDAILVAWDECHKIYLALDETEAQWFRDNYPVVVEGTPRQMMISVVSWFDRSCPLRLISSVRHVADNPNDGYVSLVGQGQYEEFVENMGEWYE